MGNCKNQKERQKSNIGKLFTAILYLFLAVSCSAAQDSALPTPLPTAIAPTTKPEPTAVSAATSIPSAPETTSRAVTTPIPLPPIVNINMAGENGVAATGGELIVRGRMQGEASALWLSLWSANGRLLAEAPAEQEEMGWRGALSVPEFVSGAAAVYVSMQDENGDVLARDSEPLQIALDTTVGDRYLALFRPSGGETAVAGFNFFFDGIAQQPVGYRVTLSIWVDNCTAQIAEQTFVLNGSGYWQGFVVLPTGVSGPGCAVARFGAPGDAEWREAVVPINILPPTASEAKGITIANPPPGRSVEQGDEVFLYGTAFVSEGIVSVKGELENGRIVAQNNVATDEWGYWEHVFRLPAEVAGKMEITVSTGESGDDNHVEEKLLIDITELP